MNEKVARLQAEANNFQLGPDKKRQFFQNFSQKEKNGL